MHVLLVTHRYPPDDHGGVERYTQALAAELVKAGDTVAVVARRPDSSSPEPRTVREWLADGTSLYRFTGGQARPERFLLHHNRLEQLFTAALLEEAPDVVHFNHLKDLSPGFVAIAHRLRAAVVVSLHDFYFACPLVHLQTRSGDVCLGPDGGRECARTCFAGVEGGGELRWGLRTVYFRRLLSSAQRAICYSRYVASYFEGLGTAPARLRVIPHGVTIEAADRQAGRAPHPQRQGGLNLAYCGTVARHKGVHVILEALATAELGPVNLAVIGQAPDPEYVREFRERAAAAPGLTLRMHGKYEPGELRSLLGGVDCVIVPSLVPESGGIVPREALALGAPVVVARIGALPELVVEGENGFTFDPNRPGELAAVLRRLVRDGGLLGRLHEGALRTPVRTVSQHAEAVRAVYREAVEDLLYHGALNGADVSEFGFLHRALVGCGGSG
jgi:glycosyltransferase involved in cell wall biosynthesis